MHLHYITWSYADQVLTQTEEYFCVNYELRFVTRKGTIIGFTCCTCLMPLVFLAKVRESFSPSFRRLPLHVPLPFPFPFLS